MKFNNYTYTHQGKRDYQEDKLFSDDNILLVADGVGGHAKGDEASRIVVEVLKDRFEIQRPSEENLNNWVKETVNTILDEQWSYAKEHSESMGMGSTLAVVLKVEGSLYSVHIGDSRVYHFSSDGTLKWVSKDHSFVQELIDINALTVEQAVDHPNRNVITRVLTAKENHQVKASISQIVNIEKGDYILVCSDGVNESWTDEGLSALIGADSTTEEKIREIEVYCAEHSRDNNTAILSQLSLDSDNAVKSQPLAEKGDKGNTTKPLQKWKILGFFILSILCLFAYKKSKDYLNPIERFTSDITFENSVSYKKELKQVIKENRKLNEGHYRDSLNLKLNTQIEIIDLYNYHKDNLNDPSINQKVKSTYCKVKWTNKQKRRIMKFFKISTLECQ